MMKIVDSNGLSFDDVLIRPTYSEVRRRSGVDLSTSLGNLNLKLPFIAANMATVCEYGMASAMDSLGGLGVVHRNIPLFERFNSVAGRTTKVAVAFGVNEDLGAVIDLANRFRTPMLVLDIAHGHSRHALDALTKVKNGLTYPATMVGGNIATAEGVVAFADAGADVVKVGIGPGSVCSTRVVTGVGVPQLSAISECADAADLCGVQVIADGGIKRVGDAAKALAVGADAVMLGNMLAGTKEAPGKMIEHDGKMYKAHYGMASEQAGSAYAEGVSGFVPYRGPVEEIINELVKGVSSTCSYVNAHTLSELQRNAEFIQITSAGLHESAPHDIMEI
jgi:IMP dehydrogenase